MSTPAASPNPDTAASNNPTQASPAAMTAATAPDSPTPKRVSEGLFKSFGLKVDTASEKPKEEAKQVKSPEEKPKDEKPAGDEKPKEEKPKIEPFEPNRRQPKKKEEIDVRKIVKETAAAVLEESQRKPEKQEDAAPELPKAISRKVEALEALESEEPSFKGSAQKVRDFYKKGGIEDEYRTEWRKKNPGKVFNREDEEHDDFYAANDPLEKISEDDMELGRDLVIEKRAIEKSERVVQSKLSDEQRKSRISSSVQTATRRTNDVVVDTLASMNPDFVKPEVLKTFKDDHPLEHHLIEQEVERVAPVIEAACQLFAGAEYNERNPLHQEVARLAEEIEQAILRVEDNTKNGLPYATLNDWAKMSKKEQAKHWTIGEDEIIKVVGNRSKAKVLDVYKKVTGGKLSQKSDSSGAQSRPASTAAKSTSSESSPSVTTGGQTPGPGGASAKPPSKPGSAFFKSMIGV